MAEKHFNIVFQGELVAGADMAAVKQNLAKVFKMDAAKVEALFTGKKVILKKNADQPTAMKFRAVLKQAGAHCHMVACDQEEAPHTEAAASCSAPADAPSSAPSSASSPAPTQPVAPATPAPAAASQAQSPDRAGDDVVKGGSLETVGTIRTGGEGFSAEFDVAEVGADIADQKDEPTPPDVDFSQFSLAPPGADLEQLPDTRKVAVPDISHLKLEQD